jgi:hypothetical protein
VKVRIGNVDVVFIHYVHVHKTIKQHRHPDDHGHIIVEDTRPLHIDFDDGDMFISLEEEW